MFSAAKIHGNMQENNSFTLNGFCSIIYFMAFFCAAEIVTHVQFSFWLCLITAWGCINTASKHGLVLSFLWKGGMVPNYQLGKEGHAVEEGGSSLFQLTSRKSLAHCSIRVQGVFWSALRLIIYNLMLGSPRTKAVCPKMAYLGLTKESKNMKTFNL